MHEGVATPRKSLGGNLDRTITPQANGNKLDASADENLDPVIDQNDDLDNQQEQKNMLEMSATFIAEKAVLLTRLAEVCTDFLISRTMGCQ